MTTMEMEVHFILAAMVASVAYYLSQHVVVALRLEFASITYSSSYVILRDLRPENLENG